MGGPVLCRVGNPVGVGAGNFRPERLARLSSCGLRPVNQPLPPDGKPTKKKIGTGGARRHECAGFWGADEGGGPTHFGLVLKR